MDFASDNAAGASRKVLDAIIAANEGPSPAYGADAWTQRAEAMLSDIFEREVAAFLVATGTGANALALGAVTPPWGAVYCHEDSHVSDDECGAPEMFTHGAKLVGLPGALGKITPEALADALKRFPRGLVKQVQPASLSLSQATECGTAYALDEIAALARAAHAAGVKVHMDGARFTNAMLRLGCTPAQMTWKAGIDVLSFGGTKNGLLGVEAVVFFDPAKAWEFELRRKRGGHLFSKHRFLSAQMEAYLSDGLWLRLATQANAMGQRLVKGLRDRQAHVPPADANMLFPEWPAGHHDRLEAAGAHFYRFPAPEGRERARLVASWSTTEADVDRFLAAF